MKEFLLAIFHSSPILYVLAAMLYLLLQHMPENPYTQHSDVWPWDSLPAALVFAFLSMVSLAFFVWLAAAVLLLVFF